jgi:serine/threonine protein phosphatase 1
MRSIFIGDVHGMRQELECLLDTLDLQPTDKVIFVGDLVDKGDDSPGVVRLVRRLSENHEVVVVEGNHEEKHRTHRRNLSRGIVREGEVNDITKELTDEDIRFMESFVPFHRVPEHGVLVVHGGIPGNWEHFPESIEEFNSLSNNKKKRFLKCSRTRVVCRETGKFRPLGHEHPEDPFWTEVWDGRFGHVIFGHEPFLDGPDIREHSTGIDTGCVHGGSLTGLIIESDGSRSFVSVPGRMLREPRDC